MVRGAMCSGKRRCSKVTMQPAPVCDRDRFASRNGTHPINQLSRQVNERALAAVGETLYTVAQAERFMLLNMSTPVALVL